MLKLPKFFNIFGIRVKLKYDSKMPTNVAGYYYPDKELITLNPLQDDKEALHSLIHEAGHSLFYRISINQSISYEVHEYIVNNMATMLLENFDIKFKKP